ncbi:hypothetical protein [Aquabacter cavernae]|uniref:hypothetical protein n=1 Tax=Aquabacter cavernae TaxID=2496029 RepID=UPI000F8CBBA2|nr:hypothetical protein [Aquabacter cavernae]
MVASAAHKPELIAFIDSLTGLIAEDRYAEAAAGITAFNKTHHGLAYFIEEALPSRVSDHLLKKTGAHTAFTTFTLRRPNWATELNKATHDPEAFAAFIGTIEAEMRAIAGRKAA